MAATPENSGDVFDVLIIGAGFGGLYALHRLREDGLKAIILEMAPDAGGAWYWNSYPGARCDVESLVYSYSFSPIIDAEWTWTERYSGQDEICRYLQWVATRLDLRRDIRFDCRVESAYFDREESVWLVTAGTGDVYAARHFISAAGPISEPIMPDIPGLEDFTGLKIHTARWPKGDVDLTGKRIGVIGTGSSGTQLIPIVAQHAAHLYVFMRTRNYYSPAHNRALTSADHLWWSENRERIRGELASNKISGAGDIMLDPDVVHVATQVYGANMSREERAEILERRWCHGGGMVGYAFRDVFTDAEVNAQVTQFFRDKIHTFVGDPALAEKFKPHDFPFGTKRPTVGSGFFETFERPNVTLIDVKNDPIEKITANSVVVAGQNYELDALILASGFDALTGALTAIDIRGEDGSSLREAWVDGAKTYLGVSVVGFPNFYMIGGPGSPSVLSNVVNTNEFQVDWIAALINRANGDNECVVRVTEAAEEFWSTKMLQAVSGNAWSKTESWYVGANVPGKKVQILTYTGGMARYRRYCNRELEGGFASYRFS